MGTINRRRKFSAMAKLWVEFDLITRKHTGNTHLFMEGITPEYYLNIRGSGWQMSEDKKTCMNPKQTVTWHIKGDD